MLCPSVFVQSCHTILTHCNLFPLSPKHTVYPYTSPACVNPGAYNYEAPRNGSSGLPYGAAIVYTAVGGVQSPFVRLGLSSWRLTD